MDLAAKKKLIVALDVPNSTAALALVEELQGEVGFFKVGLQLFTAEGPKIVREITQRGGQVFLDLKFHDIPNTVMEAGERAASLGVYMYNVHAAGGLEMMRKTKERTVETAKRLGIPQPIVLAVTVLTSMNEETLNREVGISKTVKEQVAAWAKLAKEAGLDGVVASSLEVETIRAACGPEFILVTPGIRPSWSAKNDQQRIMTPKEAIQAGSDFIVVGRPITAAASPREAARRIIEEMGEGYNG